MNPYSASTVLHHNASLASAQLFTIEYMDAFKVLRNIGTNVSYVLIHCGLGDSDRRAAMEEVMTMGLEDAPVFDVPVKAWSSALTVPITFIDKVREKEGWGRSHLLSGLFIASLRVVCVFLQS